MVGSYRVFLPPPILCSLPSPSTSVGYSNTKNTNREVKGLSLLLVRQECHRQRVLEKSWFEGEVVEFSWLGSWFYCLHHPQTEILPPSLRWGSSSGPCTLQDCTTGAHGVPLNIPRATGTGTWANPPPLSFASSLQRQQKQHRIRLGGEEGDTEEEGGDMAEHWWEERLV